MGVRRGLLGLTIGALALSPLVVMAPSQAADAPPLPDVERVVDPAPDLPPSTKPSPRKAVGQAALAVPSLSSRPASLRTIYLDFDGVTLSSAAGSFGRDWTQPDGGGKFISAGTYAGFTDTADVPLIWKIVAEKYSSFDVNVTTVDPGTEALRRTDAADAAYGVKVVITDATAPRNQICGGCGGIANVDLFDGRQQNISGASNPMNVRDTQEFALAWVFSAGLADFPTVAAHAIAHEVGHTLGLDHDGDATHEYYGGHSNHLWTPIMGIGNQNAIIQFSKGEYAGASNTEDDLAIIGTNGVAGTAGTFYRPDDYTLSGGVPTGAAALGDQTSYSVNGVISNAADDDLFSITRTCTSPLTVSAKGIGTGQALDIKLDILSTSNVVLAAGDNPATVLDPDGDYDFVNQVYVVDGMNAEAKLASPTAGTTYRIKVDGAGSAAGSAAGNATTGYTDYGSIGQYTLTISGCPAGAVPGPPATVTVDPGVKNTTAGIYWTAPSDSGGSPITGYQITGLPGGTKTVGNVLNYDATGLNPGTNYTVTVYAVNSAGTSATGTSKPLHVQTWKPETKPGLTAALTDATAKVTWTAPPNPGNATLTGWHVVGTGASPVDENLAAATLTKSYPVTFGTTTYQVTASYTADLDSVQPASDPAGVTRSVTAPNAPASGSAKSAANGRSATLTWTAPTFDGGAPVTGYVLVGLPGGNVDLGNVLTYTAPGLTPGKSYSVFIGAKNSAGTGAGRTVNFKTNAAPSAPRIGTAVSGAKGGAKNATAKWAAPTSSGGAAITSYKVVAYKIKNGKIVSSKVSKALSAGTRSYKFALAKGSYKFRVVAYNAVGASPASAYSKLVKSR
ncbi:hypothetical protein ABIE44_002716 [Marmoricola sp. OAE513]|uniref:fibronectin type III domain-containing protein n=1 Tax=Marmoricola sp. OAE513 TaxID=2817894 RepID=UPI001AE1115A